MITAKDIYNYIDSFAPFETAMNFDNVGLLVGNPQKNINKAIVTLDVTSEVINEAVQKQAELIISHHPVIFNPIKSVLSNSIPYILAQNNLTVISAHTNLDIARDGVNDTLAEKIGVQIDKYFDDECALTGHLNVEQSCEELAYYIKEQLNCNGIRFTKCNNKIKNIVVSCGAGGNNVFLAKKLNADALVTGEIKHHEIIFANENNISIFDVGHYRSEDIIIEKLAIKLSKEFPNVEFEKSEAFTDKTEYII